MKMKSIKTGFFAVGLVSATMLLAACGTDVTQSLKVSATPESNVGMNRRVVILPFADYSESSGLDNAQRRSLTITRSLTDKLVSNGFNLPVQEDVFDYLLRENVIAPWGGDSSTRYTLRSELDKDWSPAMKAVLQEQISLQDTIQSSETGTTPGTHGLTPDMVSKIGRDFQTDYILRGQIIEYKTRSSSSWNPFKKGLLTFAVQGSKKMLYGAADSTKYDEQATTVLGFAGGGILGNNASDPFNDNTGLGNVFGLEDPALNSVFWGAVGGAVARTTDHTGQIPQAAVKLRVWVQDAANGEVVWTNSVDVFVEPTTVYADYEYDALFDEAIEKGVDLLVSDFVQKM